MRKILLIIIVTLLCSCDDPNGKTTELKQLNERITRLEQKIDSLTHTSNIEADGYINKSGFKGNDHCRGITKKGAQCKRKAKPNGYCWQHGG
ncbi:MAG: hypothetical protein IBJ16_00450 [Chitinophagaceae bacterium]|nr:hypothetical protein [Chitinophagaceae bacterium]